ncbi:hypothetical protein BgiBS90_010869 [Biomphalaria glabrata]|nr:hypothetical protein BgiBS90_010866 [Biomphalaria glabrata]KAI8788201.1 hypothetical protein BgiBS90_010869 [Biomphalaria glabrata]
MWRKRVGERESRRGDRNVEEKSKEKADVEIEMWRKRESRRGDRNLEEESGRESRRGDRNVEEERKQTWR